MSSTGGLRAEIQRAIASGRLTIILVVLGALGGVTFALVRMGNATERATLAGERADRAAVCSQLLLGSISDRQLRPDAITRGCDTSIATGIIARGLARDRQLAESMAAADSAQRERDVLRGQLLAIGELPLIGPTGSTILSPAPDVTVTTPPGTTPSPQPSTPSAAPTTPAAPSPSPSAPHSPAGLICGQLVRVLC